MKLHRFAACLFLGIGTVSAQVATGVPPLGSFGGGPFDVVNLGNLNVHFVVPVLTRPGRGSSFAYSLVYDSSVWSPATSNGVTSWVQQGSWGWTANSPSLGGFITTSTWPNFPCISNGQKYYVTATQIKTFTDPTGISHPVGLMEDPCETGNLFSVTSRDGSGWTIYYQGRVWATSRSGQTVNVPSGAPSNPTVTYIDSNANEYSEQLSGQTLELFDTLSSTTPVLAISGGGTSSSPTELTYTAPSGGNASYTINYTQYTVATNFGVSNVREFGPLSETLISSISLPDGTSYSFTYEKTPGSCTPLGGTYSANCITARIASVTLPTNGSIAYGYTGGSNGIESDGSTSGLTRTLNPGAEWQYSRTQVSGSHWQTTVTSPPDPVNSGSASDLTLIDFQEDSASTPTYNFYETQRAVNQGTSTLLQTIIRCYNAQYTSCPTTAVSSPIAQIDVYTSLPNGNTRASELAYNGYGLLTSDTEYNYGVAAGAAPSSTYRIGTMGISYYSLGNGIVDRFSTIGINDWSTGSEKELFYSQYGIDQTAVTTTSGTPQHGTVAGARGNVTTAQFSTTGNSSNLISQTFTYYDTGNPIVATDVNGAQSTYLYASGSCGNSFPTGINEPLSLSRSMAWNCSGGVQTQITDENGNKVTTNYTDSDFWRPGSAVDQLNNETTIAYSGQTAVETALLSLNGGNSSFDFRTTLDALWRPILSQRLQAPGNTNYDTTETDYDIMGRPSRTTMPFVAGAGGTSSTAPSVKTTYDALSRRLTSTDADGGSVSYTYVNNDVLQTVTGGRTFQRQYEYDGFGRLVSVCEITSASGSGPCGQSNGGTGFLTKYTSDFWGHILTVTQNAQPGAIGGAQARTYTYDGLGRLTSETNPETNNLAYTYVYDTDSTCGTSNGDLVKRVDAVGNVTCYGYDKLHRVTATTYPSGTYASSTPTKCYVYDAATVNSVAMANAKGRLAEAYTGSGTSCPIASKATDIGLTYSARGEVAGVYESTPHSSSYYYVGASYWAHGLINQLTSNITSLPTLSYGGSGGVSGLDGEGRLLQVTASSGQSPVTGVTYTTSGTSEPIGFLTNVTYGSADSDTFQHDPNTGRLTQYKFNVGTTNSVTGNLEWSSNGTLASLNITDQLNSLNSQSCVYGYDDEARVTSANCGNSIWNQNFSYDAFGNIAKSVPLGGTGITFQALYNGSTNWLSSVSTAIPTYDNDGNLTYDTVHNLTWDSEGNMLKVDSTAVQTTYDAFDRAVEQNRGGSYTEIVYAPSGGKLALMNGSVLVKAFAPLPSGATAVYATGTTGPLFYRHSDWLGTSRLATTQSRTVYYDGAYAPFGENYNGMGTSDLSFAGQNQDTEIGYYDALFREFSPVQGRWLSPDPAGLAAADPTNPQSWNRYAYVLNNPLVLVDFLGLNCVYLDSSGKHVVWVSNDDCATGDGGFQTDGTSTNPADYYVDSNGDVWSYQTGTCSGECPIASQVIDVSALLPPDITTEISQVGSNCQAPFLCNQIPITQIGPSPQKPNSGTTGTKKYLTQYVPCAIGEGVNQFWGDDEKAAATVLVNIAPFAPASLLKGGPWTYLLLSAAYDVSNALQVRQSCTKSVYGGG